MKNIGILKEIDNIGRIVIPKELRQRFQLEGPVELVITVEGVLIRNPKYELIEISKDRHPQTLPLILADTSDT